ncbi:chloride channel protein, CIC family [Rhodoblastus acidophilus]|uniref:Chloride channel protein, CIC family n=1 Tax=Rhodoblastus acidophilus TaxID=1074 RepID=A0A212RMQ2_RHOAC|nr:chloride channel protein [Rhodoblastus acidophilus]PPQ39165.1 chloride channel protein [Rhodoblastus acidophilus]RAI21053.1 chloride channel protein [Rhodoblastus acidophilus]SNB73693.1 chloride channel protein, CIC family [Rhodoblastus acidophilus]
MPPDPQTSKTSKPSPTGRLLGGVRAFLRANEFALVAAAALIGGLAALCVIAMTQTAIFFHEKIYDLPFDVRLSAAAKVSPWAAFSTLILAGLALGAMESWRRRKKQPAAVDPVEANALRGGRMSLRDSVVVALQTLVSNSAGASVGLEAGYAQIGAALGSTLGQKLRLRRNDLRLLVGAGAAAAIAGAFNAPLTGAFYGFEVVLGSYAISGAAPIFAAAISGTLVTKLVAVAPYQIETPHLQPLVFSSYLLLIGLAALTTALGVFAMRAAGFAEKALDATRISPLFRPVVGAVIVATLAVFTPQVLGAGHGALALDVATDFPAAVLLAFLGMKLVACLASLASGFRGGLFFASLLMGALLGKIYALGLAQFAPALAPDATLCMLAGMATLGAVIVGGPLTMAFLVLEGVSDFSAASAIIAATVAANLIARATFGYSFSTWRLHLRGATIRSANDIGWIEELKVGKLMRPAPPTAPVWIDLDAFCQLFPAGGEQFVALIDREGRYAGLVNTTEAHAQARDREGWAKDLARHADVRLTPDMNAKTAMALFDKAEADLLAVVHPVTRAPLGAVTETFLARRYAEHADAAARNAIGI